MQKLQKLKDMVEATLIESPMTRNDDALLLLLYGRNTMG